MFRKSTHGERDAQNGTTPRRPAVQVRLRTMSHAVLALQTMLAGRKRVSAAASKKHNNLFVREDS